MSSADEATYRAFLAAEYDTAKRIYENADRQVQDVLREIDRACAPILAMNIPGHESDLRSVYQDITDGAPISFQDFLGDLKSDMETLGSALDAFDDGDMAGFKEWQDDGIETARHLRAA